jgi:hypothetical protein
MEDRNYQFGENCRLASAVRQGCKSLNMLLNIINFLAYQTASERKNWRNDKTSLRSFEGSERYELGQGNDGKLLVVLNKTCGFRKLPKNTNDHCRQSNARYWMQHSTQSKSASTPEAKD